MSAKYRLSVLAAGLGLVSCSLAPLDNRPLLPTPTPQEPPAVAAEEAVWSHESFRLQRPTPGPVAAVTPLLPTTYTLPGGVTAYAVPQPMLPAVELTLQFDVGAADDPLRKEGMHSLCMDLLDESTRSLDRTAFAGRQADLGVSVSARGALESSAITVRSLSAVFPEAFALFADTVRKPGLRARDLERLRARRKAGLRQARATPQSIARRLLPTLVWGPEHPYGRLTTEASLDNVRVSDCRALAQRLGPKGARLFISGGPGEAALAQLWDGALKGWKGDAPRPRAIPPAAPKYGAIFLVDVPGAAQSVISIGAPGPARTAPDHAATHLMAQILGGSFSSRINMNLREDKGYTYGGRGRFTYRRVGSHFVASSPVRTDATGPALRELAGELLGMRTRPAAAEEIRREQEGAVLALPSKFSTPRRALGTYRGLVGAGLPLDWYTRFQRELREVDAAAIQQAAINHIPEQGYVVLVVGDAAKVRPELDAIVRDRLLGLGHVVRVDADGRPLP